MLMEGWVWGHQRVFFTICLTSTNILTKVTDPPPLLNLVMVFKNKLGEGGGEGGSKWMNLIWNHNGNFFDWDILDADFSLPLSGKEIEYTSRRMQVQRPRVGFHCIRYNSIAAVIKTGWFLVQVFLGGGGWKGSKQKSFFKVCSVYFCSILIHNDRCWTKLCSNSWMTYSTPFNSTVTYSS